MRITVLYTQIKGECVRCEWDPLFGRCYLVIGNKTKRALTLGGLLKRKIKTIKRTDQISLDFVPVKQGRVGLFILKKNDILYKAAGLSLRDFQPINISEIPLKDL